MTYQDISKNRGGAAPTTIPAVPQAMATPENPSGPAPTTIPAVPPTMTTVGNSGAPVKQLLIQIEPPDPYGLVTHTIIFPNLFELTEKLLRYLDEERDPSLKPFNYPQLMAEKSVEETAEELVSFINPEIKELQGETITALRLLQLENLQSESSINWEVDGGYLDFITDDRNPAYFRSYVGQSNFPKRRENYHINAILANYDSALHYHVPIKGYGHRHPNFIQLWKTGPDQVGEFYDQTLLILVKNILEMVPCMAFQTLPPTILKEYFEPENVQNSTMLGLNIVPPLYQTVSLGQEVSGGFFGVVKPHRLGVFRSAYTWSLLPDKTPHVITNEDYVEAVKTGTKVNRLLSRLVIPGENTSPVRKDGNIEEWFIGLCNGLETTLSDETTRRIPFGSLEAKIGVVFDQVYQKEGMDESTGLPYGIKQSGFNETNILAWPWSFRQYTSADACRPINSITRTELVLVRNYTKDLIARSRLQVIILCGNNPVGIILTEHLKERRINIALPYGTIEAAITNTPVHLVAPRKKGGPRRFASKQQIEEIKDLYRSMSAQDPEDAIVEPVSAENSPRIHSLVPTLADSIQGEEDGTTNQLIPTACSQYQDTSTLDTHYKEYDSQDSETEDAHGSNEFENFQIGGVDVGKLDQALELAEEITSTMEDVTITINEQGQSCIDLVSKPRSKSGHSIRRWSSNGPSNIHVRRTIASLQTGHAPMEGQRGNALVKFEFAEGRHDNVWALRALDTDPCRRLAIRVTLTYEDGSTRTFYPQSNSECDPYKANSVVDWVN
uniref:Uncharacterized protein n=1 Tax=Talaromyces marneffei PM1 TaxID=1077442 RepID=A0A093V5P7_TALMA